MKILLANPRGFCAGVDRAVAIVEHAIQIFGSPVYVRHAVVHNRSVVSRLEKMGAIFTDEIEDIPIGSVVIFSAHGVSKQVRKEAKSRNLKVFDATCPLVTKVHMEVARCSRLGLECLLIGHKGHPEVEGTMGQYDNPAGKMYIVEDIKDAEKINIEKEFSCHYVTQTTLSVDDTKEILSVLKRRFPGIQGPKKEDICYATTNRQNAVRDLAKKCEVVIVIGSDTSSNSNRLKELSERMGKATYLVDNVEFLRKEYIEGKNTIGVTAGASAPEFLVQDVLNRLKEWGAELVEEQKGQEESISFALPRILRDTQSSR